MSANSNNSNVIIGTKRSITVSKCGAVSSDVRRQGEQKNYVIRESCPSPLGENELIDEEGDPFEPILCATQQSFGTYSRNK